MLTYTRGDLFAADVDALTNAVNSVGVMGAGIALAFKKAYPANFKSYAQACKAGKVRVGEMFVSATGRCIGPKWIINFPTKEHWRDRSRMEWIERGLIDFKRTIQERNIKSVALPALGAGNGGLHWPEVRQLLDAKLAGLDEMIVVYEPK